MDFKSTAIPWIGKTGKLLGVTINKIFKDNAINLTREQFIVLKYLNDSNGLPQHNLAFITESDKTSFSRLISNLEKNNLITRKNSSIDKRIKNIFITALGKESFDSALPLVKKSIHEFQNGISIEHLTTTIETLKKIQENIYKEHSIKL